MPEKKQVSVRIPKPTKNRWEDYIEESLDISSMSDLIRLSVEREIERGSDSEIEFGDDIDIGGIEEVVNGIEAELRGIREETLKTKMMASDNPREMEHRQTILKILPTQSETPDWYEDNTDKIKEGELLTPAEVAEAIPYESVDPSTASTILEDLCEEFGTITRVKLQNTGEPEHDWSYYRQY